MSEESKTNSGAPSSDTTSALFVSARKKQLEQQETERRAKEKEDERLKAEAEVRRLEAEVAERKRRAEEEARRVAQEEEQSRRDAEERRRKAAAEAEAEDRRQAAEAEARRKESQKAQASGQTGGKTFSMPKLASVKETFGGVQKKPLLPIIIIAGAAALVLIVILVLVLVPRGNKSNPADQTGTDIGDYASLLVDTYGDWYLNGDLSSLCFATDGDGNWDLYDGDGNLLDYGYFTVDDDGTIWAESSDDSGLIDVEYIEFAHEDCFYIQDEVFYSEAFSTATSQYGEDDYDDYYESALYIDPDAELNNYMVIDGLGMVVYFPDTVFQTESLTDGRLILSSLDGTASLEAAKGDSYVDITREDMEAYRDKKLDKLLLSLPGEVTLLDSGLYDNESGIPFVYFKLSYNGTYETRYVCFIAALWVNERTGATYFYDFVLDCPEELTDDYMALFNRIRSSVDDA